MDDNGCDMCDLMHSTCSKCRAAQSPRLGFNTYRLKFLAKCPNDGAMIFYKWELKTPDLHMVEDLKAAVALITEGHQERIADDLHQQFGGEQRMWGIHQGVEVETVRLME